MKSKTGGVERKRRRYISRLGFKDTDIYIAVGEREEGEGRKKETRETQHKFTCSLTNGG